MSRARWLLFAGGSVAAILAAILSPANAAAAAKQDWPPFVLVTGLLVLGLVADREGLFEVAGSALSKVASSSWTLFLGAALLVAVTTALLNLDTAVVFLTPVLVLTARRHGSDEVPFLYLAIMMANGASLLLPGSNLTNLIVADHLNQSGGAFAAHMAPAWAAVIVVVTVVVALWFRRRLGRQSDRQPAPAHLRGTVSVAFLTVALVAVLVLPTGVAAVVTLAAGGLCLLVASLVARRSVRGMSTIGLPDLRQTVDVPLLVGLFGLAVGLGCLGRSWVTAATQLSHLSSWETAGVGAGLSVAVNNLPAASFLAARSPAHPYALLVGLNLGPNLAVTGALSSVLWLQVARRVGARPSAARFSMLGVIVAPLSMAAALLALNGTH